MQHDSLVHELFAIIRQYSQVPFQEHSRNFATGEMAILFYLNSIQDGATAGDICNYLQVTTGRIASALNSLEKKNFIQRKTHEKDKRKVKVCITSYGRDYVLQNYDNGIVISKNVLENLGEKDTKEFIRIVKKLMDI